MEQAIARRTEIAGFGELFSRAWNLVLKRGLVLLGLFAVGFAIGTIGFSALFFWGIKSAMSGGGVSVMAWFLIGFVLFLCCSLWLSCCTVLALIHKDMGFGELLGLGAVKAIPFVIVMFGVSMAILGGFIMLIIPGIFLILWLSLTIYVYALEDKGVLDSMLISHEYVRGHTMDVFLRLIPFLAISIVLSFIPIIGNILTIVLNYILLAFVYELYLDLKEIKGTVTPQPAGMEVPGIIFAMCLGFLVGVVLPIAGITLVGKQAAQSIKNQYALQQLGGKKVTLIDILNTIIKMKQGQSSAQELIPNWGSPSTVSMSGSEPVNTVITSGLAQSGIPGTQNTADAATEPKKEQSVTLYELLKDPDWIVRRDTLQNLGELGAEKDIAYLKPLLKDKTLEVRQAASAAIKTIQSRTMKARPRTKAR